METTWRRLAATALALTLAGAACGSSTSGDGETAAPAPALGPTTPAATLRATLQRLLGAHVVLATAATDAVLDGRAPEVAGARAALVGANTDAIADVFGEAYGSRARSTVASLWRRHLRSIFDYTTGLRGRDQRASDAATAELLSFSERFGAQIEELTAGSAGRDLIAALVRDHVVTLKAVIDAQHADRHTVAIAEMTKAYKHMGQLASGLTDGVVLHKQVEGDSGSQGADLRASLNDVLGRHVALAALTTGAALGDRAPEQRAVSGVLTGSNSEEVAASFSSFGPNVEKEILALWRAHIGFIVDYTTGKAGGGAAQQREALADLEAYAETFGAALNRVLPALPADDARGAVSRHVETLIAVIDAQAAGDFDAAYEALDEALAHMDHLASALATAILAPKA